MYDSQIREEKHDEKQSRAISPSMHLSGISLLIPLAGNYVSLSKPAFRNHAE
jgi:hypothetical protein